EGASVLQWARPRRLPKASESYHRYRCFNHAHLSLLESPSGSKVTEKRTRSSAQPMVGQAEMSRIGSGVAPPGIDRPESRRTLPARIETIRDFEERGHATRVYR